MFRNKRLLLSFFVIAMVSFFFCERVNALSIDEKINGYGVYLCYTDNPSGVYPVKDKISLEKYKTWSDIFDPLHQGSVSTKSTESNLRPTSTCKGIFSSAGKTANTSNDSNKRLALEKYGYVGKTTGQCIQFSFNRTELVNGEPKGQAVPVTVQGLCSSDPNNLTKENVWIDKNSDISWPIGFLYSNSTLLKMGVYDPETNQTIYPNNYYYTIGGSLSSMKDKIDGDVRSYFDNNGGTIRSNKYLYTQAGSSLVDAAENSKKSEYELENRAQSAFKLLGISSVSDLMFTPEEKYTLYNGYLSSIFGINASNIVCDQEESPGSNYVLGAFAQGGTYRACWATALKNDGQTVNALSGNYFNGKSKKTWQELVQELYEEFKDQIGETAVEEPQEQGVTGGEEYDDDCYKAGIDGVSWIACPALTNLTYTANGFDGIIDGMLAIKPEYYNTNSDAHTVWEVMRNVANVAMIVILLIIIVSQISGYGVDNYGIKKMLPKLIIIAIIMNFSFIICELVIDLSNIVGVGLRDLFGSIGQSIGNGVGKGIGEMVSVLLGIAGGVGAVAGSGIGAAIAAVGVVSGPMVILMIIMALLGVIVSLLIFFASLGIRLMLVIICIGVAPVAMVCYILPNTKKGFDTWWKAFKSCLIIYPICGAMLGISELIKGIAWSSAGGDDPSGIALKLVALIAPYLPFFLMPSLLRGAIASVSNLSGVIDKVENRVRGAAGTASKAFKDTTSYGNAMEAVNLRRKDAVADRTIRRLEAAKAKSGGKLNPYQNRFLARAYATKKSLAADRISDQVALINEGTNNGENVDALYKMYDEYVANGDAEGAVAVAQIAGRRGDTAAGFMAEKFIKTEPTSTVAKKVAKEIATGANSKNYRASSPAKFEYASQINKMSKTEEPIKAKFDDWEREMSNMHDVIDHHITDTSQLMSMKDSEINHLYELMGKGAVSDADVATLQKIARDAKTNHEQHGGPWDETKAVSIEKIINYHRVPASSSARSGGGPSIMVPPRRGQ